ncbi:hypothetical protein CC78DRAFT_532228 [Lojkania enalia]|uniref:F-box domain-containing protein n=1 Tax=Lojkania enalia TaxID=147567 RepID=A0A9P4KDJ1_9PLEO|nr:hypothetical protein CC78DRAFT_532228 [Didymosphaeria enalia]
MAMIERSFARPTTASIARASPKSAKVATLKKPKWPSTLPGHNYDTTLDLNEQPSLPIKSADPNEPCPIARLPMEIRIQIYAYLLPIEVELPDRNIGPRRGFLPHLLHICRVIRSEAASQFYTFTVFKAEVRYLDFSRMQQWLGMLPLEHRQYASHNRNLTLRMIYEEEPWDRRTISTEWYWKLNGYWHRFGSLYQTLSYVHKTHFVQFCRLADWFLWCGRSRNSDFKWKYDFAFQSRSAWRIYVQLHPMSTCYIEFLTNTLGTIALPCVQKANRDTRKKAMKKEALNMLKELDGLFKKLDHCSVNERKDWEKRELRLRKYVEQW